MAHFEKQISSKIVHSGKIVNLRVDKAELQNGRIATREVVEHAGGVGIVALDDDDNLILVRQFRYPIGKEIIEIPAGKLEKGEDPYVCAARELSEETGFEASKIIYLGSFYPTPGYCQEILYIYLARGLTPGKAHPDENEFLDTIKIPLRDFVEMIMNNSVNDAKTIIGVLKAVKYLDMIK